MARPTQRLSKLTLVGGLTVVLLLAWWLWYPRTDSPPITKSSGQSSSGPVTDQPHQLRLIATGDMLPHDSVNQAARTTSGYDYRPLFSEVAPYLKQTDLSFCNQESPSAPQFPVSGYPTFNAPASFARNLSQLGCNIINLANNHANDRGQAGITATRQVWDGLPAVAVAGTGRNQAEHDRVVTFTKSGVTFAFLSYAKCSNSQLAHDYSLDMLSKPLVNQQLAAARQAGADMIIVGTHWCQENRSQPNATQESWARYLASKGVDIVIGTGPHWLQPVQQLPKAGGGKTLVWYSLGNFLSTQLEMNGLIGGIAVMDIDTERQQVTNVGFLPTYMHYEWTAAQAAREDLSARHNLKLYPLDQAGPALARSQHHTSVQAQTERVRQLLNHYMPVSILTSHNYRSFGQR